MREKLKTFKEVIDGGYTYPESIPADLQAVIYDWFQYRYVNDNDRFETFFTRLLLRDYEQYNQLLRIEPGISKYDWLVTEYEELQRKSDSTQTTAKTGNTSTTKSETTSGTESQTIDTNRTETGTDGNTRTLTDASTERVIDTIDDSTTYTIDETTSNNRSGNQTTDNETNTDNQTLTRALPMSTTYGSGGASGFPAGLNWETASGQEETKGNRTDGGSITSSETGGGTRNADNVTVLDGDRQRNVTHGGTITTVDSGTDSVTVDETKEVSGTKSGTLQGSGSVTETGSGSVEGSDTIRQIRTGRNGQIANVLTRAKEYIQTSNAWEWLAGRIETCFMGIYEV